MSGRVKTMAFLRKAITAAGVVGGLGLAFALGRSSTSQESRARRWKRFFGHSATQDEVITSFVEYIRHSESSDSLKSFQDRPRAYPEGALAEATVFGILQQLLLKPTIADTPGVGGADFRCTHCPFKISDAGARDLLVEATTLERTTSANRSFLT
jgi:hypothetical protein